jgi:hypothetical protein
VIGALAVLVGGIVFGWCIGEGLGLLLLYLIEGEI